MKFDDYLQGELVPKRLPSSWVTNTKFVFQSDDGSLAILDTANDSVTTLVTNHTMVSSWPNPTPNQGQKFVENGGEPDQIWKRFGTNESSRLD